MYEISLLIMQYPCNIHALFYTYSRQPVLALKWKSTLKPLDGHFSWLLKTKSLKCLGSKTSLDDNYFCIDGNWKVLGKLSLYSVNVKESHLYHKIVRQPSILPKFMWNTSDSITASTWRMSVLAVFKCPQIKSIVLLVRLSLTNDNDNCDS